MAKRFIDNLIWSDPWFQELDPTMKLFWIYLFSICDIAGIWEFNQKRAEFDLCKKLPWEDIQCKFSEKVLFTQKYWIIKTFIRQQYPKISERPSAPLHISVLNHIKKMCLNFDLNSLSIDYRYPIDSLQVKVIVKEEVNVMVKTIESREDDFRAQVDVFIEYDKTMRDNFIRYWTERNKSGAKMKFELQDTFEIKKRLVTWSSNNFGSKQTGRKLNDYEIGASGKYDGM